MGNIDVAASALLNSFHRPTISVDNLANIIGGMDTNTKTNSTFLS